MKKSRKLKIVIAVVLSLVIAFSAGITFYVNDYYHSLPVVTQCLESDKTVNVRFLDNDTIVFEPQNADKGIIFYPGGKVEYNSYAPLLRKLAENGVLCVLVRMPCNLAVLGKNKADGITEKFSEIKSWYMAGHSLGGSMSASYVADNSKNFDGLIMLAAYSTVDLKNSGLKVMSIYGSEDRVLNSDKYAQYKSNLPEDYEEYVIDGGCHAYFGAYGIQDGDGKATVTQKEQTELTANFILENI